MTDSRPETGRIVARIAGNYPLAETYHLEALASEMVSLTPRVSGLVSQGTGLVLSGAPDTAVVTRMEWIDRNRKMFAAMIEPARRRLEEEADPGSAGVVLGRRLLDAETSGVLAVLSRRVLGQYELVLPGTEIGDTVMYVGANVLEMERRHQFRPSEFRFWVALHELTHRAQFLGVPWLRDYFLELVEELVSQSKPEPGWWRRVLDEIESRRASGRPVVDERGVFGLLGSPEQNEIVDRIQALMSLLEGHGHVVMDRVGAEHLKTQARMSRILRERRVDKRTEAFFRFTGLEMKVKQYQLGERFVLGVEREAGWESVTLAFAGPESLPDLEEIGDPGRWLARVG